MKNHFFYSYCGNKREEVEHIYNLLDLENIETIVEPFCGSCALSFYIWTQNKDKNYKYILNDLDNNLIDFLKIIKNGEYLELQNRINEMATEIINNLDDVNEAKKIYLKHYKGGELAGYILAHKYYTMRHGMFPIRDVKTIKNNLDFSKFPFYDFLTTADIEIYNVNANKIIDENDNDKTLIFLDPPYIASCNNFYSEDTGENIENIYEYLYHYKLSNFKSKIIICHENNWLFKILFAEYLDGTTKEYKKTYQNTLRGHKKKTFHICIKNF